MTTPWQIPVGIAVLAASLVPAWTIDLSNAPVETNIRFWTTLVVGVALLGVARSLGLFRWLLLLLLGTGVAVAAWSFVTASTVEIQSVLITVAQAVGLGLFFTPAANAWFKRPSAGADISG